MSPSQNRLSSMRPGSGGATAIRPVQSPRKRTRSGCLPCRSRRRKCDGAHPRCWNCESRGRACQWGLKASFHRSRNFSLADHEAAILTAIEERRQCPDHEMPSISAFIDETQHIARSYGVLDEASSPRSLSDSCRDWDRIEENEEAGTKRDAPLNLLDGSRDSELGADFDSSDASFHCAQDSPGEEASDSGRRPQGGCLRIEEMLLSQADAQAAETALRSAPANFTFSPLAESAGPQSFAGPRSSISLTYVPPFWLGQAISKNSTTLQEPVLPVTNTEKARLISCYIKETGTWCETTDSGMHFTLRSIHAMMESTAFVGAAMSLASRQLDHIEQRQRPITLELYQYTIQLLLRQDPSKADASVLATCTLLCVYEMMASGVHEWRRHLKGCAGLLRTRKWNGSSDGIVKSCFWAFARIDVWAAFISGKTTLIPTDSWLDAMSIDAVAAKGDVDDYCNVAIWIFAQVVNLLANLGCQRKGFRLTAAAPVLTLWDELQKWRRLRPRDVCPLLREPPSPSRVFPVVVFSRSSSICGNTFYHAGSILLLQTGLLAPGAGSAPSLGDAEENVVWHARELAGISISNASHSNWVNHLQPLYIAGTVFAGSPDTVGRAPKSPSSTGNSMAPPGETTVEYPAEKILLLQQLARIERETGWKTSGRAADLRLLWGFG